MTETEIVLKTETEPGIEKESEGEASVLPRKQLFGWIGAIIILLDQLTKWQIEASIPLNTSVSPIPSLYPYFQLSHVANTGMAFGFLPQAKWIITVLGIFVVIWLAYFNHKSPATSIKLRIALGLLFGGALGNWIDRIRIGYVTDFLNFNLRPLLQPILDIPILDWYVFNVADMALSSGIAMLIYIMLREPEILE